MARKPTKAEADLASQYFREKLTPAKLSTIFRQLMEKASLGSLDAIKILLERAYGKPTESVEVSGKIGDYSALPVGQIHGMIEQAMLERGFKLVPAQVIDVQCEPVPKPVLPPPEPVNPLAALVSDLTQEFSNGTGNVPSITGAASGGTMGDSVSGAERLNYSAESASAPGPAPVEDAPPVHLASQLPVPASPDHARSRTGEGDGDARGGADDAGAVPACSVCGVAPEPDFQENTPTAQQDANAGQFPAEPNT